MAIVVLGCLWLVSLSATAVIFWSAGRSSLSFAQGPKEQAEPLADGPVSAPRSGTLSLCKPRNARAHIFDEMPPVESVRAQAKALREQSRVWEKPEMMALLPDLLGNRDNHLLQVREEGSTRISWRQWEQPVQNGLPDPANECPPFFSTLAFAEGPYQRSASSDLV